MSRPWRRRALLFNFAASATTNTEGFQVMDNVGALSLIVPAEFNGDTLTLASSAAGDTGITLTAATGRNTPTSDQMLALMTMPDLRITTSASTSGAATIIMQICGE